VRGAPPGDDEGHVRLWDTRTRARAASFRVHEDFVADMHHAPGRNALLTASGDGTLAILDLRASQVAGRSDNQEDELLSGAIAGVARAAVEMRPFAIAFFREAACPRWPWMIPRVAIALQRALGAHYMLKFLRPIGSSAAARTSSPRALVDHP
jgi:hypothetical protein